MGGLGEGGGNLGGMGTLGLLQAHPGELLYILGHFLGRSFLACCLLAACLLRACRLGAFRSLRASPGSIAPRIPPGLGWGNTSCALYDR